MLCVILQMHLFDAIPFADPQVALEAAREEPPDYLISDIVMQGMTGIELAILFRARGPCLQGSPLFRPAGCAGADQTSKGSRAYL